LQRNYLKKQQEEEREWPFLEERNGYSYWSNAFGEAE
jgi:hypothetical protein